MSRPNTCLPGGNTYVHYADGETRHTFFPAGWLLCAVEVLRVRFRSSINDLRRHVVIPSGHGVLSLRDFFRGKVIVEGGGWGLCLVRREAFERTTNAERTRRKSRFSHAWSMFGGYFFTRAVALLFFSVSPCLFPPPCVWGRYMLGSFLPIWE